MVFSFSGTSGSRALLTLSLITLSFPSLAQTADKSSKVDAPVPAVTYRSVFRETSLGVEQEKTDWRKANDDVGKFSRGHVDILKQEEMDGRAMPPKSTSTKPAAPAAQHKH